MDGVEISFNGARVITLAPHLQALLLEQGYVMQSAFACAVNGAFVPRTQWPAQVLHAGDRMDVVSPITGG